MAENSLGTEFWFRAPKKFPGGPKMVKFMNFFIIAARTFKFGFCVAFGSLISYQSKNFCFGAPFGFPAP